MNDNDRRSHTQVKLDEYLEGEYEEDDRAVDLDIQVKKPRDIKKLLRKNAKMVIISLILLVLGVIFLILGFVSLGEQHDESGRTIALIVVGFICILPGGYSVWMLVQAYRNPSYQITSYDI
ncbi:hypothetical protein PROFUN_04599 [Planoprotostelium fungivorum]|uniref:Transmembrane protein 230 n=1 Tax=Planoprotostelium fungivorum TaxID=1890364 RepID=A0A2P6NUC9_9EUKA|nr:hypothetical protein PROFUN_04599 [Planoprotostelium fungivorum]